MAAHLSCNRQSELFAKAPFKARLRRGGRSWFDLAVARRFACACACGAGIRMRRLRRRAIPSKNITIVVSIGAGTGMDVLVRLYAEKLPGGARQAGGGREQARRRDHAGGGAGRDLAAGRPHAGGADQRRDGDQPVALQADQLQPGKRLRADFALREVAVHPGGQSEPAVQDRAGVHQARQGGEAAAQLRDGGRGRVAAPVDGVRQAAVRLRRDPCAVPPDRTVGHRPGRGPRRRGLRRGRRLDPADQGGQAARARGVVVAAAAAAAGRAAVLGSRQRAGFRGGVLARPAGAGEDAEGYRRSAARRDEEDHGGART